MQVRAFANSDNTFQRRVYLGGTLFEPACITWTSTSSGVDFLLLADHETDSVDHYVTVPFPAKDLPIVAQAFDRCLNEERAIDMTVKRTTYRLEYEGGDDLIRIRREDPKTHSYPPGESVALSLDKARIISLHLNLLVAGTSFADLPEGEVPLGRELLKRITPQAETLRQTLFAPRA